MVLCFIGYPVYLYKPLFYRMITPIHPVLLGNIVETSNPVRILQGLRFLSFENCTIFYERTWIFWPNRGTVVSSCDFLKLLLSKNSLAEVTNHFTPILSATCKFFRFLILDVSSRPTRCDQTLSLSITCQFSWSEPLLDLENDTDSKFNFLLM